MGMAEQGRSYPRWLRVVVGIVLLAVLIQASIPVLFIFELWEYPIDYRPDEGRQIVYAARLLEGESVYGDGRSLPLLNNVHGPVFPYLTAAVFALSGPTLQGLRGLGLFMFLAVLVSTVMGARRLGLLWPLALVAALLVAGCFNVSFHYNARADVAMTFFCVLGFFFLTQKDGRTVSLALGGACSALALFSKQTAIFGVVAVHLHLLISRPRHGLVAGASGIVSGLVLLGVFYSLQGYNMIDSLFFMSANRSFEWERLRSQLLPAAISLSPLLLVCLIRMYRNATQRKWTALDSYIVGHGLMAGLILFDGSGAGYLAPLLPGLSLAAAEATQRFCVHEGPRVRGPLVGMVLVVIQLALHIPHRGVFHVPNESQWREADRIAGFLKGADGPVYTEMLWGAVAHTRDACRYYVEPTLFRSVSPERGSRVALESAIQERRFARIVLFEYDFHYPGFTVFVLKHYRVVGLSRLAFFFGETRMLMLERMQPLGTSAPDGTRKQLKSQ